MNNPDPKVCGLDQKNARLSVIVLLLALAFVPLMITGESLWLDEGDTALYAIQPTANDWLQYLGSDRNADCQMPLTMWTAWATAQVTGTSEWSLRLQNIFWAVLTLVVLFRIGQRLKNPWLPAVMVIQPFFWFYMDEARPYLAEVALGSVLLLLMMSFPVEPSKEGKWVAGLLGTIVVIYSISMLCAVTVIAVLIALIGTDPRKFFRILGNQRWIAACFVVLIGALSAYYLWTLTNGAGGSRIWPMDIKAVAFIGYELVGCLGLGPSLDAIRAQASAGKLSALLPELILPSILGILLTAGLAGSLGSKKHRSSTSIKCLFVILFTGAVMLVASVILHKPLWARHFSPVLPFLVFVEAALLSRVIYSGGWLQKAAALVVLALLAASSFQIRFSPRFAKDDYRQAATIANAALQAGNTVWWSAAEYPAMYYHVPLNRDGKSPGAVVFHSGVFNALGSQPDPDLIIATRPEVYDPYGKVNAVIQAKGYFISDEPKNFRIYNKPAP